MPTAPPVGDRAAGAAMAHASASMADEESRHLWSVQSELRSALSLLERARRNRACARALALDAGEPARGSWAPCVFPYHFFLEVRPDKARRAHGVRGMS